MPPTTTFISTSQSPAPRGGARGLPPSTRSSRCSRGLLLPDTSAPVATTAPRSSTRPASTSDFERILDTTDTARELYHQVLSLHPDRINPGALWLSAVALRPL